MTTIKAAHEALQAAPSSPIHSLADLEVFLRLADLPTRPRQDMLTALTTLARAAGKPLSALPAEAKLLRHTLNRLSPTMAGVSDRRWSNVRSLLRRALEISTPDRPRTLAQSFGGAATHFTRGTFNLTDAPQDGIQAHGYREHAHD